MLTHVDMNNFEKEVLNEELPVIIDFWASWCAPCRMLAPIFEETSKEYEGKLKFAKLNTEENVKYAEQYKISSIPCLVIVHKGEEIGRIVGLMPKEVLMQKINEIMMW